MKDLNLIFKYHSRVMVVVNQLRENGEELSNVARIENMM